MADERGFARSPDVVGGEQKAESILLGLERQQRKLARQKCEAKAVQWKALQKKQVVVEESQKRQRICTRMHSYFTTSRNSENRSDLSGSAKTGPSSHSCHGEKSDPIAENPDLIIDLVLKPECTIDLSILGVVALTSELSAYVHFEVDSNTPIVECAIPSELEEPKTNVSELEVSDNDEFLDKLGTK